MSSASRETAGRPARPGRRTAILVSLIAVLCSSTTASALSVAAPRAHGAVTLSVKDDGNLRFVRSSGSTLIDEGHASGTIPGNVRIHFTYNGNPNVSAAITIYGQHGQIQVKGSGRLSSPNNPDPSFSGTLTITGGSGRYAHARGSGKLYGVFHRRGYGMVFQVRGTLRY
jgi:hypothetical protein